MTNLYMLRTQFNLKRFNTAITRTDFCKYFFKTNEQIRFSFGGWDGKSYDGESRTARVYRINIAGLEDARFIKVGKGVHYIDGDRMIEEKATGKLNHAVSWLVDVLPEGAAN